MRNVDQIVKVAMKYNLTQVMERYAEKTRLPAEVLSEHEREIKRFLALSAANPGKYGMRGPLDELWHTFILFTSSYAEFCRILGGGFIHHLPESPENGKPRAAKRSNSSYLKFLADYKKIFKEEPPIHMWPRPISGPVLTPSCNECGNFCSQTCVAIDLRAPTKRG